MVCRRVPGVLKERTYGAAKRMILAGTLRPGEKLAERDLSRLLKVSRTPLREGCARQEFRHDGRCNAPGFWYWSAPGTTAPFGQLEPMTGFPPEAEFKLRHYPGFHA
jgi:hypothetical protein